MKLLILSNNPSRASFRQRIGIYISHLKNNGIECDIEKIPAGCLARIRLFKKAQRFDTVFLHKKGLNPLDAFFLKRYSGKIIYDFDDAIMYKPTAPQLNSKPRYNKFRRSIQIADLVIAGNDYLAEHAHRFNRNIKILPTGLDISEYNVYFNKKDNKIRLVWIGSSSTLDYLEQLKPVLEEIGEENRNVILRIICDTFFDMKNMPIEKKIWSKEEQVRDLVTSDIGIAPLPDNRFTRGKCGFKVLQYAAAGLPVVASPVGINGQLVREGETGFYAKDNFEWKQNLNKLIKSARLREKTGNRNRELATQYDTSKVGEKLIQIIKSV